MEHTDSSFLLSCLEKQVKGGLYHLMVPEPLNSLMNHLQSVFILITGCVMMQWSCRLCACPTGAAVGATQVNVEVASSPLMPPAAVVPALMSPTAAAPVSFEMAAVLAAATEALSQGRE